MVSAKLQGRVNTRYQRGMYTYWFGTEHYIYEPEGLKATKLMMPKMLSLKMSCHFPLAMKTVHWNYTALETSCIRHHRRHASPESATKAPMLQGPISIHHRAIFMLNC